MHTKRLSFTLPFKDIHLEHFTHGVKTYWDYLTVEYTRPIFMTMPERLQRLTMVEYTDLRQAGFQFELDFPEETEFFKQHWFRTDLRKVELFDIFTDYAGKWVQRYEATYGYDGGKRKANQ